MKKIISSLIIMAAVLMGANSLAVTNVYAAENACGKTAVFMGLRPWYYGLTVLEDGKCEIKSPNKTNKDDIPKFIWTVVLNVLSDIMTISGYIGIVMFMWGGFLYMFSRGMPDRAEKGKKTLIAAVIGLLIVILANVIINTIVTILTTTA